MPEMKSSTTKQMPHKSGLWNDNFWYFQSRGLIIFSDSALIKYGIVAAWSGITSVKIKPRMVWHCYWNCQWSYGKDDTSYYTHYQEDWHEELEEESDSTENRVDETNSFKATWRTSTAGL